VLIIKLFHAVKLFLGQDNSVNIPKASASDIRLEWKVNSLCKLHRSPIKLAAGCISEAVATK
jgi:hypothetical protein